MIVIVGESASGKSTLQKELLESLPDYKKVITYTTRPMRNGEEDGVDYNFVPEDVFKEMLIYNYFVEYSLYNGWYYGIPKNECGDENKIIVLTPAGLRKLKQEGIKCLSIYLYVDRESRLIKAIERGDDIDEAYRRNLSDAGQFDGVEREVDYVIENQFFRKNGQEILNEVLGIIKMGA